MFGAGWGANQFASLLVAYHRYRGVSVSTDDALFGVYALGLVPALLLSGPASDRWGRVKIVRPAALLSALATLVLIAGSHTVPLLYAGRFLAGIVSGSVLAAGTAWVKELSVPPFDESATEQSGARRAAVAVSLGFGLGPLAAGLLAQWGPVPLVVAYLPHLAIMALAIPLLWRAPETHAHTPTAARAPDPDASKRFRIPAVRTPRFRWVVIPIAPWVFASASVSFAVLPTVVSGRTGGSGIAFAGLVAFVTLGVGVAVQPFARRIDQPGDLRGAVTGVAAVVVGMLLAALAARLDSPPLVLVAAVALGAGYGFCLVGGLLEVQRMAGDNDLASFTSVYYSFTYVGFAVPLVLAELHPVAGYPILLVLLAALAAFCLVPVTHHGRRSVGRIARQVDLETRPVCSEAE